MEYYLNIECGWRQFIKQVADKSAWMFVDYIARDHASSIKGRFTQKSVEKKENMHVI